MCDNFKLIDNLNKILVLSGKISSVLYKKSEDKG